ncbi:muscle-specific protein 300 kDa-like isoform X1 [Vespa velutina]|uniref:muscle-specific protein 300 kDa-like isoform X1 n=1 Tax=Vespa velutina TaxID=202808 RepID=UPI001FB33A05|nr:muscle-specific protein 300 kDa-like isoform X1 [Vespa velutina]
MKIEEKEEKEEKVQEESKILKDKEDLQKQERIKKKDKLASDNKLEKIEKLEESEKLKIKENLENIVKVNDKLEELEKVKDKLEELQKEHEKLEKQEEKLEGEEKLKVEEKLEKKEKFKKPEKLKIMENLEDTMKVQNNKLLQDKIELEKEELQNQEKIKIDKQLIDKNKSKEKEKLEEAVKLEIEDKLEDKIKFENEDILGRKKLSEEQKQSENKIIIDGMNQNIMPNDDKIESGDPKKEIKSAKSGKTKEQTKSKSKSKKQNKSETRSQKEEDKKQMKDEVKNKKEQIHEKIANKINFTLNDLKLENIVSSEILTETNKSDDSKKEVLKQDNQLQLSEKSWTSIISTKDTADSNKPVEQIETIIIVDTAPQDAISDVKPIPVITKKTSSKISQKQELEQSIKEMTAKKQKKKIEEKEAMSTSVTENVQTFSQSPSHVLMQQELEQSTEEVTSKKQKKTIEEKKAVSVTKDKQASSESSSQVLQKIVNEDNSKSYLATFSHGSLPQLSQKQIIHEKSLPLKTEVHSDESPADDIININVDIISEKGIKNNNVKIGESIPFNETDYSDVQVTSNNSKGEVTSWAEEIEKKIFTPTVVQSLENVESLSSTLEDIEVFTTDLLDTETISTTKADSWAAIVARKTNDTVDLPPFVEQNTIKNEKHLTKEEYLPQVQIFVDESPQSAPIENLVHVDDQGFVEFINRKELRTRRSRSRSRTNKSDDFVAVTVNTSQNKTDATLDSIEQKISTDVKSKTETSQDKETKNEVQKQKGKSKSKLKGNDKETIEKEVQEKDETVVVKENSKGTITKDKTSDIVVDRKKQEHEKDTKFESRKQKVKGNAKSKNHDVETKENNTKLEISSKNEEISKEVSTAKIKETNNEPVLDIQTELKETNKEEITTENYNNNSIENCVSKTNKEHEINLEKTIISDQESIEPVDKSRKQKTADEQSNNSMEIGTSETNKEISSEKTIISDQENKEPVEKEKSKSKKQKSKKNKSGKNEWKESVERNESKKFKVDKELTANIQITEKEKTTTNENNQITEKIDTIKNQSSEKIKDSQDSRTPKKERDEPIGKLKNRSKNKKPIQDKSKVNVNKDIEKSCKENGVTNQIDSKTVLIETETADINTKFIEEEKLEIRTDTNGEELHKENENNQIDSKLTLIEVNQIEISYDKKQMKEIPEHSQTESTIESKINEKFILEEKLKVPVDKNDEDLQLLQENKEFIQSAINPEIKESVIDRKIQQKSKKEDKKKKKQSAKHLPQDNLSNKETEEKEIKKQNAITKEKEIKSATLELIVHEIKTSVADIKLEPQEILSGNVHDNTCEKCVENKTEQEEISLTPKTIALDSALSSNVVEISADKLNISDHEKAFTDIVSSQDNIISKSSENTNENTIDSKERIEQIENEDKNTLKEIEEHLSSEIKSCPTIIENLEHLHENKESIESDPSFVATENRPKVRFYIADDVLILTHDKEKELKSAMIQERTLNTVRSKFLSLDSGFWPTKHPYHEAEKDLFESLAHHIENDSIENNKKDSSDRDPPDHSYDDDNNGGGSRGGSGHCFDNSRTLLGSPRTECLVTDLPGGICSWRDYSTYLSSENEEKPDNTLQLTHKMTENLITKPSLPSKSSSSSTNLQLTSKIQMNSNYPTWIDVSNNNNPLPSDHSNATVSTNILIENEETMSIPLNEEQFVQFNFESSSISTSIPNHPEPSQDIGRATLESLQQWPPNEQVERETRAIKDKTMKIRGIKVRCDITVSNRSCCTINGQRYWHISIYETIEARLTALKTALLDIEATNLSRDSIESMLSATGAMITKLQGYDEETIQLQQQLCEIPINTTCQIFTNTLESIQSHINTLLTETKQSYELLEQALEIQRQRTKEIKDYQNFLEETDVWLKDIVVGINESITVDQNLQVQLLDRTQRVSKLESLPEVKELAKVLKNELMDLINRLQQKQQELLDEEAMADDENTDRDDATIDQAPSIHSTIESNPPSLADVSLQTGQSLLLDIVEDKPLQLTKQTSTTQIPVITATQSLMTQTMDTPTFPDQQIKETIKVVKLSEGDHDVIEIATKNVRTDISQNLLRSEQSNVVPDNIIVDMKYQDGQKEENAKSELNIHHATPQSFETVLFEPDDVTTEVVVDADGTKRIIVRKLRQTVVSNRHTQQHASSITTALGEDASMMQAFSEATLRDQYVTVTTTKPDGTVETLTKQIHGSKVTTGIPDAEYFEEKYESTPQYTHRITQGAIRDISPLPIEEQILEHGQYQTKTSSVHAVVQQVTRRVIKKTRRIIRKVTIIDGKETTSEEIIEEPEEIEIDEQDIPHININVIKDESEQTFGLEKRVSDEKKQEPSLFSSFSGNIQSDTSYEQRCPDSPMQGPFFGPFAKDMSSIRRSEVKKKSIKSTTIDDTKVDAKKTHDELKEVEKVEVKDSRDNTNEQKLVTKEQPITLVQEQDILTCTVTDIPSESVFDIHSTEDVVTKVNNTGQTFLKEQVVSYLEDSIILQTPDEDIPAAIQSSLSSEDPVKTDNASVTTKATCKSDDAPVSYKTPDTLLESGTVEVAKHNDGSNILDADKKISRSSICMLEDHDTQKIQEEALPTMKSKLEDNNVELQRQLSDIQFDVKTEEVTSSGTIQITQTTDNNIMHKDVPKLQDKKQQVETFLTKERKDIYKDNISLSEQKSFVGKVEISLSIQKHDEKPESMVYIKTQSERSNERPYHTVLEDVKISLPADQEASEIIHNKTVQTSPVNIVQKGTVTTQTSIPLSTETSQQESVNDKLNLQNNQKAELQQPQQEELIQEELQQLQQEKLIQEELQQIQQEELQQLQQEELQQKELQQLQQEELQQKELQQLQQEELQQLQQDAGTVSPISTTIAESVEISVLLSESPEHISEQPQTDIVEITDSLGLSSHTRNDSFGYDHGYEPDDRTTVEEPSSTQGDDDIGRKKKKKKRKKQKIREIIEDSSGVPKSSSDEADSASKATISDKKDNIVETEEIEIVEIKPVIEEPEINVNKVPIDTQSVVIETCNVSISPDQNKELVSIRSVADTVEQEIRTFKVKETDSHMQISPQVIFESAMQTVQKEIPEIKESSIQTITPTRTLTIENAIQTSPIENVPLSPIVLETKDSHVQTVIEMDSTEIQTSPIECVPSIDTETQTLPKVSIDVEQQTSAPAAIKQTSPYVSETVEVNIQTSKPPSPEKPEMLDFNIQAELLEKAIFETAETQTISNEPVQQMGTQETETQTKSLNSMVSSELHSLETTETQTTPEESLKKIETEEREIQVKSFQLFPFDSIETQTTPAQSPRKVEIMEKEVQVQLINNIPPKTMETQTTPKESPRKIEILEREIQAKSPPPITNIMIQTNPVISLQPQESYDLETQIIQKSMKYGTEEKIQTSSPILVETISGSVQVESKELMPLFDKTSQISSESCEKSLQVSLKLQEECDESTSVHNITEDQLLKTITSVIPSDDIKPQLSSTQSTVVEATEALLKSEISDVLVQSEKSSTPDTSFEVHIKTTIELPNSEICSEAIMNSESSTDISQDVSLTPNTNDNNNDNNEAKLEKRQRRKRKHKTMEIQLLTKETNNLDSIFGQPAQSQNSSLKLSYSDITKKNSNKQPFIVNVDEPMTVQSFEENDNHASSAALDIDDGLKKEVQEMNLQDETIPMSLDTSIMSISQSSVFVDLSNPSKSDKPFETSLTNEGQRFETLFVSIPSEPMDTTISPDESPSSNQIEKPVKTQVKTYAEAISQLLKPSSTPGIVEYEKEYDTLGWENRLLVPHSTNSHKTTNHVEFSLREAMEGRIPQHQPTQKIETTRIISDRVKNLHNAAETDHLGNVLHIARLSEIMIDKSVEERSLDVRKELTQLRNAVEENDIVIVEETLLTVIETISTWLETIEYRIFLNRECPSELSHNDAKTFIELKEEVDHVEENIRELNDIWKHVEGNYPIEERVLLRECFDALEQHMKAVEHVTNTSEKCTSNHLAKWDELLNGVNNMYRLVEEQRKQLDNIIEYEASTRWKLQELDKMENMNRCHMWKTRKLLATSHELLRDYPGKIIPEETYLAHEITKIIENSISIERDRLLQLLALAEEYEQTLQEFSQIIEIAENLLQSPISVMNLEHLQEEMQKHRKFFVNLNHCRAILESLEGNLDPETRAKHSNLHVELHSRASSLLDQAASRAQQMALAATRWILLEQGVKEEKGWLQVAHQRVPDLQTVTSSDYDQYISLYQSLSSDVATHHARIIQLLDVANRLEELVTIENSEDRYNGVLDVIVKLQDSIESSLRRLLSFRENWSTQQTLINRIENWIITAEKELVPLSDTSSGNMRRFWELKAQYEIHNNMRNEADKCFDQALKIIPLSDEMFQRQFHGELQYRWKDVTEKINEIQSEITRNISSEDISSKDRLKILERELNELRMCLDDLHGVLKTEEELDLYIERLTVLFDRVSLIQDKLSRLGLLSAAESETVGILLSSAHRIESQISEELDSAQLLREKLQALKRGLGHVRKAHQRHFLTLDQCEKSEKQGSNVVSAAIDRCESVSDELIVLWHDLMGLRHLLHKLPSGMRVSVSPVSIERDISALQDAHTELECRCSRLLSTLRNRLALWNHFEKHLEMVQQSVQEADYMMELLTVQGSVDYDRLLKATERLEGLNGDFGAREVLISELHAAAEPLRESCAAEVRERVEAAVNEAVRAWEDTKAELNALCTKYQHACNLWQQYRDSSAVVKAWMDTQMGSVANLPPEEAIKQVKVCEETLAEHKERLAELRGLVAQIASDVGLDAGGPLHCEVEALGRRLEDVRETLSTLADTADVRVLNQELTHVDLCQTKNFLDTVQQSLTTVGQEESNEHLKLLRNHLLALTRTEPQLQSIKDRTVTMSTQEPSVVEILQQWQRVFKETFQHYHRLSIRLFKSQDVIAVLKLWQEHLTYVQEFLSNRVPGDYNGLSEHRNLCEVYRNLLTDQQNHLLTVHGKEGKDLNVTEQFNALTNLHNETLAKIMERHTAVHDRLLAWDNYRRDQNDLFAWLKDIERERSRLQLRFIHVHRLDKILQRIQALLEKVPSGEAQIESLQKQQIPLLVDCDETLAVSVRMEHAANVERIANLRAGLETWRDFVERVRKLHEQHMAQTDRITNTLQDIGQILNSVLHSIPGKLSQTKENLLFLQELKTRLVDTSNELESLNVLTKKLRECLSPSDMKSLNQHVALLWQQQGDLDHQLALVEYKLGERCGLHNRWIDRQSRLLTWIEDAEIRVKNWDMIPLGEPEKVLKRFEYELQAEIALKQREFEWVQKTGQELIDATDDTEKAKVQNGLDEVNEKWCRLLTSGKVRANKLHDLIQSISTLEKKLIEQRSWMTGIETQLSENFIIETVSQSCIDKKLEDHEYIQKAIQTEGAKIGEVLNLCEILLHDSDIWKTSLNTDTIKNGMEGLQRRWKTTCVRSAERKQEIILAWKLLREMNNIRTEHEGWITQTESALTNFEKEMNEITKKDTKEMLERLKVIMKDIEAHEPALKILEQNFGRLAKARLEPENLKALTAESRKTIDRWLQFSSRTNSIIAAIEREQIDYHEFSLAHGAALVSLTQIDIRLTQLQHLLTPEQRTSPRGRLQRLSEIEKELNAQNVLLQKADKLALEIMQESHPDDVTSIQELVDEYQSLWKEIKTRVTTLRTELESQEKSEVDEAIQVETLKFEQDTAVQVNTLPRLIRMTSCDAYMLELKTALTECHHSLDALETTIAPEPVSGPSLNTTTKTIAKLIGCCQSSIELVRHLHTLLMEDTKFNVETTISEEVQTVISRYEALLLLARTREQQIRELRSPITDAYSFPCNHDSDRLTCPLCSRRNWTQLDNDLWRLEKWLEFAEGTQSEQNSPPSNIEDLEYVIQEHREFLQHLDSHKSIVVSLNIVGVHLAEHTEDTSRAIELRDRLTDANTRWDKVCLSAEKWQEQLRRALISNHQFHRIIEELFSWLEKTEIVIRTSEPIDLSEATDILETKYNKFRELRSDLERCEPRVLSLQESANQLLNEQGGVRARLQELRLKLQSLRRLTGIYSLKLGAALGLDPRDIGLVATSSSLAALSRDLLDEAASGSSQPHTTAATDGDERHQIVPRQGYSFLGRVLRVSLPIQALMLLLLGVTSLIPSTEEDYNCMLSNNLARSFTLMVYHPNGPPPL